MTLLVQDKPMVYEQEDVLNALALRHKPMVYEQKDVLDALVMRHGLMQKAIIHLNP